MEKRFILFITASLFIMLAWSAYVKKAQPVANNGVTVLPGGSQGESQPEQVQEISGGDMAVDLASEPVVFEAREATVYFDEATASIRTIEFADPQNYTFRMVKGLLLDVQGLTFAVEERSGRELVFSAADDTKTVVKRFDFSNFPQLIELRIEIRNLSDQPAAYPYALMLGGLDFSVAGFDARYQDIPVHSGGKIRHVNGKKAMEFPQLDFIALRDRYYCAVIDPGEGYAAGFVRQGGKQYGFSGIYLPDRQIPPDGEIGHLYRVFCGPQDKNLLSKYDLMWSSIVNYGIFDPISTVLIKIINFLHDVTSNWGVAIILLSGMIYLLLFPLTIKQMRSMKAMQTLQPHIDEIRNTYKDNPQKMNKEIFELYKQHKVNPLSGCFPLLIQMPIFIALYPVLMRSTALRGAHFLWIRDLSAPDRLATLPFSLPFLGNELNLLPILMAVGMFVQQKTTARSAGSSQSAEQQRLMMIMFPVVFGFIFYRMPSGLVLYWLVNSVIMLVFQLKLHGSK